MQQLNDEAFNACCEMLDSIQIALNDHREVSTDDELGETESDE